MDRLPKIADHKSVERAARFKDIVDRAAVAKPVDTGKDILDLGRFPRLESL